MAGLPEKSGNVEIRNLIHSHDILYKMNIQLGNVILGNVSGRESDDELTLFKSTGLAIFKEAIKQDIGTDFEF